MVQLVRITGALPEGFHILRRESESAGHRHLARLEAEWVCGETRFDGDGEVLLAAFGGGELVGIGGLTREPSSPTAAVRIRRIYVAQKVRRTGVGRTLVSALLQEALGAGEQVTVHADPRSTSFWEAMGFQATPGRAWSHSYVG